MTQREHIFSFGHPGFQTVFKSCNLESVKSANAQILSKAVAEQLAKADTYVEANVRWSYVDVNKFVELCKSRGFTIKEIDSEEVFHEACFEVRRSG
jgi:hypothetical protein